MFVRLFLYSTAAIIYLSLLNSSDK